ncbi:IBR/half ring-finger domain containing protein [Nitzschia inconspicua]|uniref:IBR/half ring-finger domain containing protein n=1 Tax=Nitzschia inconspicua TaxID=303405 RepID=A0A9K3LU82_9STRA|nr:IBR/half ring-finger domain containing protein [Nitzschia inconspicua]
MNDDWTALCAIYREDDAVAEHDGDSDEQEERGADFGSSPSNHQERFVRLTALTLPKGGGFCGTVHMTLSTIKVAFARRVNDAGNYRYFTLQRSPSLKLDLLYRRPSSSDGDEKENYSEGEGPSSLRLVWEYYPVEWPKADQEPYRSCLAKKCSSILKDEGLSFAVCEFLEHHALSFYNRSSDFDDGWKNYVDPNHPDYQLIILPPEMDRMYQPTVGTLIHPQQEASAKERRDSKQITGRQKQDNVKRTSNNDMPSSLNFVDAMEFGRAALIHFWKDLYTTTCPICLDDSVLFSEGIVLPYCQHYACRDCFQMYLKYKVQDLKEYRTNPFVCPVETCKRELPIIGYCKRYLSEEDMEAVRKWYRDLKNPPCWSLDRCLYTRTCGALGSIRRRKSGITTKKEKATGPSYEAHLVYCEACNCMWCELCLKRVYDDGGDGGKGNPSNAGAVSTRSTPYNHRWHCQPEGVIKFCRRYTAASKEIQEKCQERYPWIQSYSLFCQHDGEALQYVIENGQRCPNCQTGVERIEGCFHMKCPSCATHFCYECGTELFPPYYGTHHCWEEGENTNHRTIQDRLMTDTDEQFAMALYLEQVL